MPNAFATIADAITGTLVTSVTALSGNVAGILSAPALLGVTIYILWMGYLTIMGKVDSPVPTLVMKMVKIALIVFFAVGAGAYQSLIVPAIQGMETALVGALSGVGASSIPDQVWQTTVALDRFLIDLGTLRAPPDVGVGGISVSLPDFEYMFFQLVVNVGHFIMVILAMVPYLIAKVTLGILLALGPLFIILLIWPATVRFFEAWVSAVVTAVLTFAILSAIIGFVLPIADQIMNTITAGSVGLWGIAAVLVPTYLILGWLAFTAGSVAGQLSGSGGTGNPLASLVGSGMHHMIGKAFRGSKGSNSNSTGGQVSSRSGGAGSTQKGGAQSEAK